MNPIRRRTRMLRAMAPSIAEALVTARPRLLAAAAASCLVFSNAGPAMAQDRSAVSRPGMPATASETVNRLADALFEIQSRQAAAGALPDNGDRHRLARAMAEDALRARLHELDPEALEGDDRTTYEMLVETLEAERAVRRCRRELWNISHISGWQIALPALAERQPVGTDRERADALQRWRGMGAFVDTEIANLERGLALGYSVPGPIVARVIAQLDAELAKPAEQSSYASPAARGDDVGFRQGFLAIVRDSVRPSLRRYRDYLAQVYRPRARTSLGISALPDGAACYQALLRQETTLARSPDEVMAAGEQLISSNRAAVTRIGRELFGTDDYGTILKRAQAADENGFASAEESLRFAREFVARAKARSTDLFPRLPGLELVVEPFPAYLAGSGMNPYYEPPTEPGEPGRYFVNPASWRDDTKGFTEVVAVHEGWPGHHVQVTLARATRRANRFREQAVYGAFAEGWARYIERLADEQGLYRTTPYARIAWRMKPGFGMVVDPGLHRFGWSRQQAAEFLRSSGLFPSDQSIEDMIDRITVMPAQLTAYDSGAAEFLALREEARGKLGPRFDLRRFHEALLSPGFVPLTTLRRLVTDWIHAEATR